MNIEVKLIINMKCEIIIISKLLLDNSK